jgi:polyisoprenoid-binding protein YceI
MRFVITVALLTASMFAQTTTLRETVKEIDPASELTIYAYKSGLFAFAAHDHVIAAPIVSGRVVLGGKKPSVRFIVDARSLKVLDPKLDPEKRLEVQSTMLGPKVLNTGTYPQIVFDSTKIELLEPRRWKVSGILQLTGALRPIAFEVTENNAIFQGTAMLRQKDFGITPVSIAGGSIKVKDEVKIEFSVRLK